MRGYELWHDTLGNKHKAQSRARLLRRNGHKVRVVKHNTKQAGLHYEVWVKKGR